ncbi:RNA-guided endonuclease TnpB family protein [Thermogladius sp. 4427co]|uniref:RNA-guided endonuclease TnpB family protein n=1 Tax=Thermogladius sp. 4427co TaxID=3450718 RepID=UPI003F79E0B1
MGDEGVLTLTIGMKVSPEPRVVELLKRYRDALNYSIRVLIESKTTSISKAHKLLYEKLKKYFGLPSRIAQDCYREAIAITRSWLRNKRRGRIPSVKTLRMWLTHEQGYRVKDGYIEIIGGFKLEIIGWDRRYDEYENREARLVYKDGKMLLMITKRIPKPAKYAPRGILAVDVNERHIVLGNSVLEKRIVTSIERALHLKMIAENLMRKYSFGKYKAWTRRGVLERIKAFHRKARNIIIDWARKTGLTIVREAKENSYAVAREDLNGLIESVRELPKSHRKKLILLSYRKLVYWIDWQSEKHGVPVIIVDPRGTSTTCPVCGTKLRENGYRRLKCPKCGFEGDRDTIAILNIEKRALEKIQMGGSLTTPTAPQMKDVSPNRCGEPMNPLKGTIAL